MRDYFSLHSLRQHQPKSLLWAALSLVVLFYFCYHYVSGSRGLFAYNSLKSEAEILDSRLSSLQQENEALHRRVTLLRKDNIDQDMLDEQARTVLGYGETDEKVIPLPLNNENNAPPFSVLQNNKFNQVTR
jgi:cell division protein FtsB